MEKQTHLTSCNVINCIYIRIKKQSVISYRVFKVTAITNNLLCARCLFHPDEFFALILMYALMA